MKAELAGENLRGQVVSEEMGLELESIDISVLGHASRVISKKDKTIIVGGKGKKQEIQNHINKIRSSKKGTTNKYDLEKLDERIAKLTGGVAVIRVGAATESEMKYLKLKIEDAVNATKAALAEGIVIGGGSALLRVSEKLLAKKNQLPGYSVVLNALRSPLSQIVLNCGKDDASLILHQVLSGGANAGYDAKNDKIIDDMYKAGIIDPVKVTRSALQNAASARMSEM